MAKSRSPRSTQNANSPKLKHLVIIPLWKDVMVVLLLLFRHWANGTANRGVAVILPGQQLSGELFDALETARLLVVEVPESLRNADRKTIIEYLEKELAAGTAATAASLGTQSLSETQDESDKKWDVPLTDEEEQAWLHQINDSGNVL